MAARKKDNMRNAVEKILKKQGRNYNEWKNEVINQRKIEVMSDKDKEWTENTIQQASLELIMGEITEKENYNQQFTN